MKYWNGNFITTKSIGNSDGIYNLYAQAVYEKAATWPRVLSLAEGGLAGKIFSGSFRNTIAAGNIGSIPLTSTDKIFIPTSNAFTAAASAATCAA